MNDLLQRINDLYSDTIAKRFDKNKVGFINFDARIDGHRFCEKGKSHRDQYYDDIVYFWNLSPSVFTQQDQGPLSSGKGKLNDGWRMRPFHPKEGGHTMIKDGVIEALRNDKVEGVK